MSLTRSCRLVSISKTAYYHKSKKQTEDGDIVSCLKALATAHPRWGFDKMMAKIKLKNTGWNHKRVYRIYCEQGLNIRVKPRKGIPKGEAKALAQPIHANVCWSMDFMSDALAGGDRFRTFNVIDDYNREGLLIEPAYALPAKRMTTLLDQVADIRGYPDRIRVDHGPEFESGELKRWANERGVLIDYIQPGKPAQNGFIERFNRSYREAVLDMNLFQNLREVKILTRRWLTNYNHERPHESLAGLPPVQFANYREIKIKLTGKRENSTFKSF